MRFLTASVLAGLFLGVSWVLGGARAGAGSSYPAWFPAGDEARFPRQSYVTGVGMCAKDIAFESRRACAVSRALEEAALSVRASVTAERSRNSTLQVSDLGDTSAVKRSSNVRSSGVSRTSLEIDDAAPQSVVCDEDACYALIALSRADYGQRLLRHHSALRSELDVLLVQATEQRIDVFSAMRAFAKASEVAARLDEIGETVSSVLGPAHAPPLGRLEVAASRASVLGAARVCLAVEGADVPAEAVFAGAVQTLATGGLSQVQLAQEGAPCAAADLMLRVRVAWGEPRPAGRFIALDLVSALRVELNGRVLPGSSPLVGHAVAPDVPRARLEALDRTSLAISEALKRIMTGDAP